jgi:hypothetical protein
MELLGFFLVVGALLILLLLGLLVCESAVKLRLAWKFRNTVENACQYPDCLLQPRPGERE